MSLRSKIVDAVAASPWGVALQKRLFDITLNLLRKLKSLQGDKWAAFTADYLKRAGVKANEPLSRALATQADNPQVLTELATHATASKSRFGMLIAALSTVVGGTALYAWLADEEENLDAADNAAEEAVSVAKKALQTVLTFQMDQQGDGKSESIWGQPADTYRIAQELQDTANQMIDTLVSAFGSPLRAKQIFVALHTLELEQFDYYRARR